MNNKLDNKTLLAYLFHPQPFAPSPLPSGAIDIQIEVADNVELGCRLHIHQKNSPTIVFFHGNGENVADYDFVAPQYTSLGFNFFVATYRGYGWSSGTPTATSMLADSITLFNSIEKRLKDHDHSGPIFVMGRSIGSACAIEIAHNFPDNIKGLIIESGFYATLPLLENLGIDTEAHGLVEDDGFGNDKKIQEISLPTLILHGTRDTIIPASSAERLQAFSGARSKQFHLIPGADHNTMMSTGGDIYFATIKKFIDDSTGATNWRRKRKKFKEQEK